MIPLSRSVLAAMLGFGLAPFLPSASAEPGHVFPPLTFEEKTFVEAALPSGTDLKPAKPRKLLVFYRTEGFVHGSIPVAIEAVRRLGESTGAYSVVISEDMSSFDPDKLAAFDAVAFVSTTQLAFANPVHRKALLDFVASGKGVIGLHAATDNFPTWPEGRALMGGFFHSHPWTSGANVAVKIDDPANPVDAAFDGHGFRVKEEIYQMTEEPYSRGRQRILLSLDMSKATNARPADKIIRKDNDFAISWIREEGPGRVFYSSLGHNPDIFYVPQIMRHFLDGIRFALGDLKADAVPSAALPTQPVAAPAPDDPTTLQEIAVRAHTAGLLGEAMRKLKGFHDGSALLDLETAERLVRLVPPRDRASAEAGLVALLDAPDSDIALKRAVLRILGSTGGTSIVPVIEKHAAEKDLAEDVVQALSRIRGTQATAALVRLVDTLPADVRVSCVNALGRRATPESLAALTRLAGGSSEIAPAALSALTFAGTPEALSAILLTPAGEPRDRAALSVADIVVRHSQTAPEAVFACARDILPSSKNPEHRAEAARLLLGTKDGVALATPSLADPETGRAVARLFVRSGRADALAAVTAAWPAADASWKRTALVAAGDAGSLSAIPLVLQGLSSDDAGVRADAVVALGRCGADDAVERLVPLLAQSPDVGVAVRRTLALLPDVKADGKLRTALAGSEPAASRAVILAVLAGRRDLATFPVAVKLTKETDPKLRLAAFEAIAALAGAGDLPAVLATSSGLVKQADRRAWGKAVSSAASANPDKAAATRAISEAIAAPGTIEKPALIAALAMMPGDEATAALRGLLKTPDAEARKETIRALASARTASARTLLRETALGATDDTERTLALRGFLDTVAALNPRVAERVADYRKVWPVAGAEEKETILAAVRGLKGAPAEKFIAEMSPAKTPADKKSAGV